MPVRLSEIGHENEWYEQPVSYAHEQVPDENLGALRHAHRNREHEKADGPDNAGHHHGEQNESDRQAPSGHSIAGHCLGRDRRQGGCRSLRGLLDREDLASRDNGGVDLRLRRQPPTAVQLLHLANGSGKHFPRQWYEL